MEKKLVVAGVGNWTEKLLTLSRLKEVIFFIDDNYNEKLWYSIPVMHSVNAKELISGCIIVISNSRQYDYYKRIFESWGLLEDKNFFNGWKLSHSFYKRYYSDNNWISKEKASPDLITEYENGWKKRAKRMAKLIPPNIKSLLDIGCGGGTIREHLPENVEYYGLDYCYRDKDTIICDINKCELPKLQIDVAYLAGVFTYVDNPLKFIKSMRTRGYKYIVMSYIRNDALIKLDGRLIDDMCGDYGHDYHINNLISDMYQFDYVCEVMEWNYKERDEYYFRFNNIKID